MKILLLLSIIFFSGCATMPVRNLPQNDNIKRYSIENNKFIWQNYEYPKLKKGHVFVAPYSFKDLTGQRKEGDTFASFSSSVTQGGYAWLVEELLNAGNGEWFKVLEREGLQNVLTERNLIKNTRQSFDDKNLPDIQPMLYAGLIVVRCAIAAAIIDLIHKGDEKGIWELDEDKKHKVSNDVNLLDNDNYLIKIDK